MSCGCQSNCNCNSAANMSAQVAALQDTVNTLTGALQPFLCGHPIMCITDPNDILQFDTNGKGSQCFADWALCNGGTFTNAAGKNYTTVNLVDKFIVGAGGTYVNGATGGTATVALTANQNGTHTHIITDPGHTHIITDPGHTHGITDPEHNHTGTSTPHSHTFTTGAGTPHNHQYASSQFGVSSGNDYVASDNSTLANTSNESAHTHSGTTNVATSSVSTDPAATGVSVQLAFTGITNNTVTTGITNANSGLGDPHENLPPYYALIFIQKL